MQAQLIAPGHGFADPFALMTSGQFVPSAFHPPLYPVFLAGVVRLGFESGTAARAASCLVGVATILFVGLIGRELRGARVGLIAAAIAAATPNLWVPDGSLISEGMAAALVAMSLWFAYRLVRRPQASTAAGLGLTIGLAGLTRPETLLFSVILVGPIVIGASISNRRRVALMEIASLATIAVVAPWAIRSLTAFDRPILISANGQAVIGLANCPGTYHGPLLGAWLDTCPEQNARPGTPTGAETTATNRCEPQNSARRAPDTSRATSVSS